MIGVLGKDIISFTNSGVAMYEFTPYESNQTYIVASSRPPGQIVAIMPLKITYQDRPRGAILHIFGPVGEYEAEYKALLFHYGSEAAFKSVKVDIDTSFDNHRINISASSGWISYMCKDISISFHPDSRDTAITLPDLAFTVDSDIDRAARANGVTFYNLDGTVAIPMISERGPDPCSPFRGITLIIDITGKEIIRLSWITINEIGPLEVTEMVPVFRERYISAMHKLLHDKGLYRYINLEDSVWPPLDSRLLDLCKESANYLEKRTLFKPVMEMDPYNNYADLVNQRTIRNILTMNTILEEPIIEHMNERMKKRRRFTHDLTLLTYVKPEKIYTQNVIWLSDDFLWIPEWTCVIRARHPRPIHPNTQIKVLYDRVLITCDMMKRSWKTRITTC
jgi:hypothetical protein